MTKADIIRMAIEAELIYNEEGWCGWVEDTDLLPFIERFAELVRAEEREACAYLRKEIELKGVHTSDYEDGFWDALAKYEDMVRARGAQ